MTPCREFEYPFAGIVRELIFQVGRPVKLDVRAVLSVFEVKLKDKVDREIILVLEDPTDDETNIEIIASSALLGILQAKYDQLSEFEGFDTPTYPFAGINEE